MPRVFSVDDRHNPVYSSTGARVGSLSRVEERTARVTHDDGDHEELTEKLKRMLGWDDDADEHELRHDDVERIEDDAVYLRSHQ